MKNADIRERCVTSSQAKTRERKIGRGTDGNGRKVHRVCGYGSSIVASLVPPRHACVRACARGVRGWRGSQRRRAGGSSIIAVLWRVQSVDVLSAATRPASTMAGINGLIFHATKAVGSLSSVASKRVRARLAGAGSFGRTNVSFLESSTRSVARLIIPIFVRLSRFRSNS